MVDELRAAHPRFGDLGSVYFNRNDGSYGTYT